MAFSVPAFIHKGGFDVRIGRVDGQVSCRSAFLVAVGIRGEVCADLDAIRLLGLWDSHVWALGCHADALNFVDVVFVDRASVCAHKADFL